MHPRQVYITILVASLFTGLACQCSWHASMLACLDVGGYEGMAASLTTMMLGA